MNRSPLPYPMHRDADAGGAADLQTDIMRFMAILSLCLVAVFALVQSIPLAPVTNERAIPAAPAASASKASPETVAPDHGATKTPPERLPEPAPTEAMTVSSPTEIQAPIAAPESPVDPEPVDPEPVDTPPAEEGFTLRFASDLALTRLVARNEIGLYAVGQDKSLRMSVSRGQFSFWPASVPNQFHEMDPRTVPAEVTDALRRSGALTADASVKWGVTLPTNMRRQLDGYLAEHTGGSLVIEPDGTLELDP